MQTQGYDVLLMWHDGGSICLPTVAAMSAAEAETKSLQMYMRQSRKNNDEIMEGGGFQVEAQELTPDEAARWRARN